MTRPSSIDMRIGANLKALRFLRGLSQEQLAERVGVTPEEIQKYETGRSFITLPYLCELAEALDVDIEVLFTGLDIKKLYSDLFCKKNIKISLLDDASSMSMNKQKSARNLLAVLTRG